MHPKNNLRPLLFFIFFLTFFLPQLNGQVDSLLQAVKTMPDNEEKAIAYKDIAFSYYFSDPDKCIAYCDTLLELSKKVGYTRGLVSHAYIRSIAYYMKQDYEKSIEYSEAALAESRKQKDQDNELIVLDFLGTIYREIGLQEKAIEFQLQSLALAEIVKDSIGMAYACNNISNIFFDMKDEEQARTYQLKAIELAEKTKEYVLLVNSYSGLALYQNKDEALASYQKAMKNAEKTGSDYHKIVIYQNLSSYFYKQGDLKQAIINARNANLLSQKFDDAYSEVEAANALGDYFMKQQQVDSALFYLTKATKISKNNAYNIELDDSYFLLAELYQKQAQPEQAFDYLYQAYAIKDSVYQEEKSNQIQTASAKFEFEKNQRIISEQELAISQANNKRNRLIILGLLLLAAVTSIYQWYLRQQQKQKQLAELAFTKQQAEADRLRELDELKTNFFTNISHELRTPLTLILSPLADIQEKIKAVTIRAKLNIIKNNAQRLLGLVNEIMDLAKVEAGKLEVINSKITLEAFINRVFYSFESLAEMRRIRFQLDYQMEDQSIEADRDKLEKILHNLLSNAIKYTGADGAVHMTVFQKASSLFFEVKDTGQGISTTDLPKIFDRFYQAKQGSLQGGTGIGLALSKELAELMQGELNAKSTLGQGSTFTLEIPFTETHAAGVTKVASTESSPQTEETDEEKTIKNTVFAPILIAGEKPRLLVVEDNPELGKYLIQILSDQYNCVLATDGTEALKQLERHTFDCITSDVMMPNMDGFELREAINQNKAWKQIPFLLLTARNLEADKIRGFQMGIDDYVTKPFSTRELQARIQNLISNKLEREAFAREEEASPNLELLPVVSEEQKFLKQVEEIILKHIDDPQFSVETLATSMDYSSRQLSRLLKKYTGLSSVNFILEVRLQKARSLLEKRLCATVIETQYEVGISSTSYFTNKFTERFGRNPSDFL